MSPHLERIPPDLKALPHWVCWSLEERAGARSKIPKNPKTGANAKADNPTTWAEFGQAVSRWEAHKGNGITGIGFEFSTGDPYTGIDLDKCRNPETGIIEPWARVIIDRLRSYTEISPSGTGVHIIIKGSVPPGGNRKSKIEMYSQARFFTMTGHHLEGTPATIEPRQAEIEALHGEIFGKLKTAPKAAGPSPTLNLADSEIIAKARSAKNGAKFDRLYRGDWQGAGFPSQSEADLALCSIVALYTQDAEQIDRLYRASALNREKWERPTAGSTYGAKVIDKALSGITETYQPPRSAPKEGSKPKPTPPPAAALPQIIITKRFLHDKSNEAIKALENGNLPPFLFRRSGSLTRISSDEKDHPRIETINDIQLRGILARCAHFFKETDGGMVATAPPMDLVKDILALGEWNFPALEGIIQAPAMRLDGTVLNQPGYDPKTRLYYVNPPDLFIPAIPENPTQEAVKESIGYLLEILCDFPFCEDPDRANGLGLIITLPLRPAIPGNVPMAVITAPAPGTGKSLLQDTAAIIGTGKSAPMAGLPRDDDEMRKFITARMLAGDPLVSFDNLEHPLWGPSLSRALTCTTWEDRILGGNTEMPPKVRHFL
jgi:hypothetical protein